MAAKIISWDKSIQTSPIEGGGSSTLLESQTPETAWAENSDVSVFSSREIQGTVLGDEQVKDKKDESFSIGRMYPHVFDENIKGGQTLILLRNAINDAQMAIDAFGEPDLQSISTRMAQIAVTMGKAYALTDFNESLGGVVSFIRRATLAVSNTELTRSELNSLVHALERIAANPMIDLDDASDLVEKLTNEGWRGEHKLANELIMALTEDSEITTDELQALLFPAPEAAKG